MFSTVYKQSCEVNTLKTAMSTLLWRQKQNKRKAAFPWCTGLSIEIDVFFPDSYRLAHWQTTGHLG